MDFKFSHVTSSIIILHTSHSQGRKIETKVVIFKKEITHRELLKLKLENQGGKNTKMGRDNNC